MALSETTQALVAKCFATRGKNKGMLLSKCPRGDTLEAAAWQGIMINVNPFKSGICTLMFMSTEQKAIYNEVNAHFEAMPKVELVKLDRDRKMLQAWGAW